MEGEEADEAIRLIRLAERTADLVVQEAHARADRRKNETEQILAAAQGELARRERALQVEAARIARERQAVDGTLSRAASRLVEIVDGPDGLGPFSEHTGTLLEFAELLLRSDRPARRSALRSDPPRLAARVTRPHELPG